MASWELKPDLGVPVQGRGYTALGNTAFINANVDFPVTVWVQTTASRKTWGHPKGLLQQSQKALQKDGGRVLEPRPSTENTPELVRTQKRLRFYLGLSDTGQPASQLPTGQCQGLFTPWLAVPCSACPRAVIASRAVL